MENQFKGFDENECLNFIRQEIPQEASQRYSDDEILYVADIIWDYYEEQGLLSLNDIDEDDELLDPEDLIRFVKNELKKRGEPQIEPQDVDLIVKAELNYEESLENNL